MANLRLQVILAAVDKATATFSKVKGGSAQAAAEVAQLRKGIRELDRAQSDVSAYRRNEAAARANARAQSDVAERLRQSEERHVSAKARVTELAAEVRRASKVEKEASRQGGDAAVKAASAVDRARTAHAKAKDEAGKSARKVTELKGRLSGLGVEEKRIADVSKTLGARVASAGVDMSKMAAESKRLAGESALVTERLKEQQEAWRKKEELRKRSELSDKVKKASGSARIGARAELLSFDMGGEKKELEKARETHRAAMEYQALLKRSSLSEGVAEASREKKEKASGQVARARDEYERSVERRRQASKRLSDAEEAGAAKSVAALYKLKSSRDRATESEKRAEVALDSAIRKEARAAEQHDRLRYRAEAVKAATEGVAAALVGQGHDLSNVSKIAEGASRSEERLARSLQDQQKKVEALSRAQGRMNEIEERAASLGERRNKIAEAGAKAMALGAGVAYGAKHVADEAGDLEAQEAKLKGLGLTEGESKKALDYAKGFQQYGVNKEEKAEIMTDSLSIFGDVHHAMEAFPLLAKQFFTNKAIMGKDAAKEFAVAQMNGMKAIEMRGGVANPEEMNKQAQMMQRVISATGGKVNGNDYRQFLQRSGVAGKGLTDETFYYKMEPVIQEMGGDTAGQSLMSAYQNLYQGRTTKQAAAHLASIGLIADKKAIKESKNTDDAFIGPGALLHGEIFKADPAKWVETVLKPKLIAAGAKTESEQIDMIGSLVTNRNGSNFLATLLQQTNNGSIQRRSEINARADDINTGEARWKGTEHGRGIDLSAKASDLQMTLGQKVLPLYIKLLEKVTYAFEKLNAAAERHPKIAKVITLGLVGLGVGVGVIGALAMSLAVLLSPLMMIASAQKGWLVMMQVVPKIFGKAGLAVRLFSGALKIVGAAMRVLNMSMLANPFVLAAAAIALAAYLVYEYWDQIKAFLEGMGFDMEGFEKKCTEVWGGIKEIFKGGMDGILSKMKEWDFTEILWSAVKQCLEAFDIKVTPAMESQGKQMISSIGDGMLKGWEVLEQKMKEVKDKIYDEYSPWSKETRERFGNWYERTTVGKWDRRFTEDLNNHFTPEDGREVKSGGLKISQPIKEARPMIRGGAAEGYKEKEANIEMHIHAAPGMDEQAVARHAVKAIRQDREAGKVRARRAIGDRA